MIDCILCVCKKLITVQNWFAFHNCAKLFTILCMELVIQCENWNESGTFSSELFSGKILAHCLMVSGSNPPSASL